MQTANEETEPFEKPMLHSDQVLKQVPLELGGGVPAHELEGDNSRPDGGCRQRGSGSGAPGI